MMIWNGIVAAFRWFSSLSFVGYLRGMAAVLLGVSVFAFYNSSRLSQSVVAIESDSAHARATVTRTLQDRRRRVVSVYYKFADLRGAEHSGAQNKFTTQQSLNAGDFINIVYSRHDPQHSAIDLPRLKREAATVHDAGWIFFFLSFLAIFPYHRLKRVVRSKSSLGA